jgi:outer membrane protein
MKKIILGLSLVLAASFANAQFKKGNINITGGVGIKSEDNMNAEEKTSSYHFSPALSYFISPNLAIGAKLKFGGEKVTSTDSSSNERSTQTGVGVFGRYYFTPANKFSLFANLGFDYTTSTPDTKDNYKINETSLGLGLGMNYFVSDHFSLEASFGNLGFSSSKSNQSGDKGTSTIDLNLDLSTISFGLNYKF